MIKFIKKKIIYIAYKPRIYLFKLVLLTTLISILVSISLIILSTNSYCKDNLASNYSTNTQNETRLNSTSNLNSCDKTHVYKLPIGIIIMGILSTFACVAYLISLFQLNIKIRKIQIDENAVQ
jgi:hypothetical protein